MIISAVKGGLGNMMFQIAAGYSLSLDLNVDFAYTYDLWGSSTHYNISSYPDTVFKKSKKISLLDVGGGFKRYSEPYFEYRELPHIDNLVLDGYFQSEKYFSNNIKKVRDLFLIEEIEEYSEHTFLHVRRKDYLTYADTHPTCQVEYYTSCLNEISPTRCIVLSDDIEWCQSIFTDNIFEFSNSNDPVYDLRIMKSCKNAIISNSTFSWWGAVLSDKVEVYAPSQWFGPKGPSKWQDIYCEGWKIK